MESLGTIPIPFLKHGEKSVLSEVFVVSGAMVLMVCVVVGVAFSGSFLVNAKFSSHVGSWSIAEFLGLIPISFFKHGSVFYFGNFDGFCRGFKRSVWSVRLIPVAVLS